MALIARDPEAYAVVPQGTAAWVRERIGHLTASDMADALSFLKKGGESAARRNLKIRIVAERMADSATDNYVTPEMEWGSMYEAEAQAKYEELTGARLMPGGFVKHPTIEWCGASPDRFVDHDGLLETKCPTTATHIRWLLAGGIPEEHKPQMLLQLACTRRKWCDFASYDPRIKDERKRIFIRRLVPTPQEIAEIEFAAGTFLGEVEELFERVTTA